MYARRRYDAEIWRWALLLCLLLNPLLCAPTMAQTTGSTLALEDVSRAEIEDLVRLLEDEPTRTLFLRRLKAFMALQTGEPPPAPAASPGAIQRVIVAVELTVQQTLAASHTILRWLAQGPQHGRALLAALSDPDVRLHLWHTGQQLGLSVLLGVLTWCVLRWRLRSLERLTLPAVARSYRQRCWYALLYMLAHVLPTLGLLFVTLVSLRLLHAPPAVQHTLLSLLAIVVLYQTAMQSAWVVLAPEGIRVRLLPLTNESAQYFWIWGRRFLRYTLLYTLVIYGLGLLYPDPRDYQGLRGFLLLVFPTLVTIIVAQIVRHRRTAAVETPPEAGDRLLYTSRRMWHTLWPFLLMLYAWSLTGFFIVHHTSGVSYLFRGSITTLVTVLGLVLVLRLFNRLFDRAVDIGERIKSRHPALEEKANRYLQILRDVCNALLVLLAAGIILELWGVPTSWFLTSPLGSQILTRIVVVALAVGITSAVIGLSKTVADFLIQPRLDAHGVLHEPGRKRKTLVPLAHAVLKVTVVFLAILVVLEQLGISTGPILAGIGILGLAVGFGSQSLIKDVINGLFILFEDSLSVGDVVALRGSRGLVERLTLRSVTIRDLGANVHVIPNSSIDMVTNMTKEYSRYLLDVGVAYRENVDNIIDILREIDADMRRDPEYAPDMLEPIEIMGLDRFDDSAVVVRARLKTNPRQQWRIGREFNRRMKQVFDERNIEIPFPHRTLYWGQPKAGAQPPLHVALGNGQPVPADN